MRVDVGRNKILWGVGIITKPTQDIVERPIFQHKNDHVLNFILHEILSTVPSTRLREDKNKCKETG